MDHTSIDAEVIAGLRRHFTDAEVVELGLVTGAFLMLGRLHRAFGIAEMPAATHAVLDAEGSPGVRPPPTAARGRHAPSPGGGGP